MTGDGWNQPWPLQASNYKLDYCIGDGIFGLVWKAHCFDKSSKYHMHPVAIKIYNFDKVNETKSLEETRNEIFVMSKCHHKSVLNYHVSFMHDRDLWIVMPFIEGGSMRQVLNVKWKDGIHDEVLLASILKMLLEGVIYLHEQNIVHRDIKASNVLVHSDGQVMLSDFGVSDTIKEGKFKQAFVGSPCWMAPEVVDQQVGYN